MAFNDNFANAVEFLLDAYSPVYGLNTFGSFETGEPVLFGNSQAWNSVWYYITPTFNTTITLDTFGSDFDAILGVFTGVAVDALTLVVDNDGAATPSGSQVTFDATAGQLYYVIVDGTGGATGNFLLNYTWTAPPVNDNFVDAISFNLTDISPLTGTNLYATSEVGEPDHASIGGPYASVWWKFVALDDLHVQMSTAGSDFDTVLAIYTGSAVGSLVPVASNDDTGDTTSYVSFDALAGTTYYVAVDGHGLSATPLLTGNIVLNYTSSAGYYDTWRPVPSPNNSTLLVCRTPVGEHDSPTGFTHMSFWTHQPTGTPFVEIVSPTIASGFGWDSFGHPEWTSETEIVFWVETSTSYQIVSYTWDPSPSVSVLYEVTKPDTLGDPSVSPDGKIVFVECVSGTYRISTLLNEATPTHSVLTSGSQPYADPSFSEDGDSILFAVQTGPVTGPEPEGEWALKYMQSNGHAITTILDDGQANVHPFWQTATRIVFQSWQYGSATPSTAFQISRIHLSGSGRTFLGEGEYPRVVRV